MAKMINVDELIEFCNTERAMLHARGNSVTCAALRRVVEFAKEYAVEAEPDNGWISVEERLPEPMTLVLVHNTDGQIYTVIYLDNYLQFITGFTVTHWMPLPEPPKEDDYVDD